MHSSRSVEVRVVESRITLHGMIVDDRSLVDLVLAQSCVLFVCMPIRRVCRFLQRRGVQRSKGWRPCIAPVAPALTRSCQSLGVQLRTALRRLRECA